MFIGYSRGRLRLNVIGLSEVDAESALKSFLGTALRRRKKRYLGFIEKPKTRGKFLDAIYHVLEEDLDSDKRIEKLPQGSVPISGYRFAPPNEFGIPVDDLREVCSSSDDSFLVISSDGQFGVHGPESYIDSRSIYNVKLGGRVVA